jgi:hypothetical protein
MVGENLSKRVSRVFTLPRQGSGSATLTDHRRVHGHKLLIEASGVTTNDEVR